MVSNNWGKMDLSDLVWSCNLPIDECCQQKEVGGKKYNFLEIISEKDKEKFNCSSTCAYKLQDNPEQKFCFKPGGSKSECISEGLLNNYFLFHWFDEPEYKFQILKQILGLRAQQVLNWECHIPLFDQIGKTFW